MAFGHPRGLFRLFFIEMWERLAFYTMLNILLLYTTDVERGGLGLPSADGNEIYGLYLAFVYFTPFPGGMIADRFLGYRKAVLLGGVFMAGGLFLTGTPGQTNLYFGLGLLCIGNGFFKPNISVMVGNLYEAGDPKRDAGFNIFYMGINIGAFIASFLGAYVRNEYGWLNTFQVAGAGLLIGVVILLASWKLLEPADRQPERSDDDISFTVVAFKILLPAFGTGIIAYLLAPTLLPADSPVRPPMFGFLVGMLPVLYFFWRLGRTAPKDEQPGLRSLLPIYLAGGTFFMILHLNGSAMTQWARDDTDRELPMISYFEQEALPSYYDNADAETPRPDPRSLLVVDKPEVALMFGRQMLDEAAVQTVADANADIEVRTISDENDPLGGRAAKVYPTGTVTAKEASDGHGGKTIAVELADGTRTLRRVAFVRTVEGKEIGAVVVDRAVAQDLYEGYEQRFGKPPDMLPPGKFLIVTNPEMFLALNALFVVAFTPLVVAFFGWRRREGKEITTARKLYLGLVLTTASLVVMALAGVLSEGGAVKVSWLWLFGFYAIVTIGELFLSPMGLSLVTKVTPKRLVGLAMGGWFMATAFGNNLSGFFGGIQGMLSPVNFFLVLAGLAGLSAMVIRFLLPRLEDALRKYGA